MKPRKLILTIEVLTNIPVKEFSKDNMQGMFDENFTYTNMEEALNVNQISIRVVK